MTQENRKDNQDKKEEPQVVIDEDWKAQAQAEKERLARMEQQADSSATSQQTRQEQSPSRSLPQASFTALVSSLMAQVFFALGMIEDPKTHKRYRDLELAKHNIDLLAMLEEKTKGNLTEEEKKVLDEALYEVRMAYVRAAQM